MAHMSPTKSKHPDILQPGDRFLKAREAAELLGTTINTLSTQRTLRSGPPYYRHGRAIRYLLSEVVQYALKHRVEGERP